MLLNVEWLLLDSQPSQHSFAKTIRLAETLQGTLSKKKVQMNEQRALSQLLIWIAFS